MKQYFEVKVSYEKDGKRVSEKYLIDAISHAQAEESIISELYTYSLKELSVDSVSKKKIAEVIPDDDAEKYYLIKSAFITLDEKSGNEKQTKVNYIFMGDHIVQAINNFEIFMKDTLSDYTILSISETAIVDYYGYEE